MEQIAYINSYSISSLRNGDLSTAANLLRQALEATRSQSELLDSTVLAGAKNAVNPTQERFLQEVGVPESLSKVSNILSKSNSSDTGEGTLYLHSQGISFAAETVLAISQEPLVCLTVASSIILYNLAVVNQLQGLRQGYDLKSQEGAGESHERLTQRALSLYATSRRLMQEAGVNPLQAIGHPMLDFLTMAVSNNAGYASYLLGDYQQARSHFQQVETFASSLRSMRPFQQWDGETRMLMDQYMSDFLLNTLVLQEPAVAAAA